MAKKKRTARRYQRGLICSHCGTLKYFFDNEIAVMNSTPGRRVQCQNCGHTHWDVCPKSKRKKELDEIGKIEDATHSTDRRTKYF